MNSWNIITKYRYTRFIGYAETAKGNLWWSGVQRVLKNFSPLIVIICSQSINVCFFFIKADSTHYMYVDVNTSHTIAIG